MRCHLSIYSLIAGAIISGAALAADDQALKISGSLDMNYIYNFNEPRQVAPPTDTTLTQPAGNNKYRIFDLYHDDMNVSLAEVTLQKKLGPASALVQIGFGHAADVISPRDEVSKHLIQAHVTYHPTQAPRLSLTAGKMLTHMGLEVAKTKDNWNYSRSVLFGFAIPLWHTGLAARYDLIPDQLKGALFVYNETVGLYETGRGKTFGGQFQYTVGDNASLTYNALHGSEISGDGVSHTRTVHEIITVYQVSESLDINADVVFGTLSRARAKASKTAEWIAWSAGLKWTFGSFYLSPRYEIYTDRSGATIETATTTKPALPQRIESATLTLGWLVGDGLESRFEWRQDRASGGVFPDSEGKLKTSQTTATAGLLFDF